MALGHRTWLFFFFFSFFFLLPPPPRGWRDVHVVKWALILSLHGVCPAIETCQASASGAKEQRESKEKVAFCVLVHAQGACSMRRRKGEPVAEEELVFSVFSLFLRALIPTRRPGESRARFASRIDRTRGLPPCLLGCSAALFSSFALFFFVSVLVASFVQTITDVYSFKCQDTPDSLRTLTSRPTTCCFVSSPRRLARMCGALSSS